MNVKIAWLGAVGAVFALALGYTFSVFLISVNYFYLLMALILATLWLVAFVIQTLFIDNQGQAAFLLTLQASLMAIPITLKQFSPWFLVVALAIAVLLIWAYKIGRWRLENSMKISLAELRRHMLPVASITIVLFLIAVYIITLSQQQLSISRETVEVTARPFEPVIAKILPSFSLQESVGSFWEKVVDRVYGEAVDKQTAVVQLNETVSQAVNAQLQLNETFIDGSYRAINALLQQTPERTQTSILLTIAVILFFVASGSTFFVNLLVAALAWAIYKLLLLAQFGYIQREKAYKESIKI